MKTKECGQRDHQRRGEHNGRSEVMSMGALVVSSCRNVDGKPGGTVGRGRVRVAGLLVGAALMASCVSKSDRMSSKERAALAAFVINEAPELKNRIDIEFEDKVTLLGYEVEPKGELRLGQKVQLTMYWRCDKAIEEKGWRLFTHILDGAGERILNIDNVGPLRRLRGGEQALPPSGWVPGKVYIDQQTFTMPKKINTATVQIVTGVWKGNERLKVTKGPEAKENRVLVATLKTTSTAEKAKTRVPEILVQKLGKGAKLKIDGKLDEPAWKEARVAGPFVDVNTGEPNKKSPVQGSARLLWDDKFMYVGFEVQDEDIVGDFKKTDKDPHLWTKDTVEIMIDPDGDGDNKDYYEIQINPQNLVFDSRFDDYNQPRKEPDGPFGHQDWSAKLTSAVAVDGTLKTGDKDKGYTVEAKIPWESFAKAKRVPPNTGVAWRMNFYAMQNNGGVAWSPILKQGNFHKASRFGKVRWVEDIAEYEKAAKARGGKPPQSEDDKPGDEGKDQGKAAPAAASGAKPAASAKPPTLPKVKQPLQPLEAPEAPKKPSAAAPAKPTPAAPAKPAQPSQPPGQ